MYSIAFAAVEAMQSLFAEAGEDPSPRTEI